MSRIPKRLKVIRHIIIMDVVTVKFHFRFENFCYSGPLMTISVIRMSKMLKVQAIVEKSLRSRQHGQCTVRCFINVHARAFFINTGSLVGLRPRPS